MIHQKHCPGCFALKSGLAVCPQCGYDEGAPRADVFLPHGMILGGQYRVGRVLGRPGGFGITYLAWDVHLQQRTAIKEYLPRVLACRAPGAAQVLALEGLQSHFDQGLEHFLGEARLMARFDHPAIMRVRNFFRAHGTAYLVMDYYEGVSLGDYLAAQPQASIEPETAVRLLAPVLEGVEFMHRVGIVHRDIKPNNIYLTTSGRPILLDFGAALQESGEAAAALVLSEGYAPLEQYQRAAVQGPAADVYGLAATLYRMLKGKVPPAPLDRLGDDPLLAPLGIGPAAFEAALRRGLALRSTERCATVGEWRDALFAALAIDDTQVDTAPAYSALASAPAEIAEGATTVIRAQLPVAPPAPSLLPALLISAAILLGAAMIAFAVWLRLG